jgi:hypothetical protein
VAALVLAVVVPHMATDKLFLNFLTSSSSKTTLYIVLSMEIPAPSSTCKENSEDYIKTVTNYLFLKLCKIT